MVNVGLRLVGAGAGAACGALASLLGADWLAPQRPLMLTVFLACAGGILGVIVVMNVELAREDRANRRGQ